MGKIIVAIFFLVTTHYLQSQAVMDSVVIFDYQSANKLVRQSGQLPTFIKIKEFDTISLDAGIKSKNRRKSVSYSRTVIAPMPHYLVGIKIYFPKDSSLTMHISAKNSFGEKEFNIDTLLVINKNVQRPLMFWAMLRQDYQNRIVFYPTKFTVTNEDFTAKNLPNYVNKSISPSFIRYVCNTVTKELVDLWK